jgi:hypothetical protein
MALRFVRVPRPCGAPPLPTEAERHTVLRLQAWLVRKGIECIGCPGVHVFSLREPTMQAASDSGVDGSGR